MEAADLYLLYSRNDQVYQGRCYQFGVAKLSVNDSTFQLMIIQCNFYLFLLIAFFMYSTSQYINWR